MPGDPDAIADAVVPYPVTQVANVKDVRRWLRVIAAVVGIAVAGGAAAGRYTVRQGDTLSAIAARNHTTVAALSQANNITNPDQIQPGQSIMLTAKPAPAMPMQLISMIRPTLQDGYVVRAGDTLSKVAMRFGRSSTALAAANGITNGLLYAGARLRLDVSAAGEPPSPAAPFIAIPTTTVASTTTMAKQAKKLSVNTTTLAKLNGRGPGDAVSAGTMLYVPNRWVCPVRGPSTFMNDWGFTREGGLWHQGTDLMAPRGTPIVAPVKGTVEQYPNNRGGNALYVHGNDGTRYYFAHLDKYGAKGKVNAGTVIGYVGDTGDAKGGPTHLHFEIHPSDGEAVNPFPTVNIACR
jgi:murein DD-endopeptidase MepM/ murein hydrolase activator NlpD